MADTYKVDITVDKDIFDAIAEKARNAPALVNRAFARKVEPLRQRTLTKLQTEPGPSRSPVRWTSPRQRKKVMRILRLRAIAEGHPDDIRYRRTHKFVKAWRAEFTAQEDGGLFSIVNPSAVERYITGENQQGFHKDTGWYQSENIALDAMVEAEDLLINVWFQEMG